MSNLDRDEPFTVVPQRLAVEQASVFGGGSTTFAST